MASSVDPREPTFEGPDPGGMAGYDQQGEPAPGPAHRSSGPRTPPWRIVPGHAGPYGPTRIYDPAPTRSELQELLGLPPSFPWTPGPTLPTDTLTYFLFPSPYLMYPFPPWMMPPGYPVSMPPAFCPPRPARVPMMMGPDMTPFRGQPWFSQPRYPGRVGDFRVGKPTHAPRPSGPRRANPVPVDPSAGHNPAQEPQPDVDMSPEAPPEPPQEAQPEPDCVDSDLSSTMEQKVSLGSDTASSDPEVGEGCVGQRPSRVYSAEMLKSLNVPGCSHSPTSPDGGGTSSEPCITSAWPEETKIIIRRRPCTSDRRIHAGRLGEALRARSSAQVFASDRKISSPRGRGRRRRNSVANW